MERGGKTIGDSALEMLHISKQIGDAAGIADFSLRLNKGALHGVLGAHCTGKTTLARILNGMCIPDSGSILIEGDEADLRSPRSAAAWGIGFAGEESPYVHGLDLIWHLMLGSEFAPSGKLGKRAARKQAAEFIEQYGIPLDLDSRADEMNRAEWLWAEVLRMVMQKRDILVLDEPDAVFTRQEMDTLVSVLRKICGAGSAVLLFSRRPETVLSACEEATLLCPGRPAETYRTSEATAEDFLCLMRGENAPQAPEKKEITVGGIVLETRRLTVRDQDSADDPAHDVSFEVRSGEILCLLGRPDSGWDALGAALIGAKEMVSGRIKLDGKDISRASVRDRLRAGMAYLPRNIRELGAIDYFTLEENLSLQGYMHYQESGWIKRRQRRDEAAHILDASGVSGRADLDSYADELADESLWLAMFSRELERRPALLIVEEPTRHTSERTALFIREQLLSVRANHHAVLLLTSQPEEAMGLSDRILVLHEGEIMGEFDPANTSARELGWYMSGQWRQQRYGGAAIEGEDE